jgi:hypothetical protein
MNRRTLRFHDFDAVLRDARALLAGGYSRAGNWSLGQVCQHLATVFGMSLDGFPSRAPWPIRLVARTFVLGRILRHKVFYLRAPSPKYLQPPGSVEDAAGLQRLEESVKRLAGHTGAMQPHPIFGELTAEQWLEVHLWHCEHHFSFLLPREGAPPAGH